MSRRNNQLPDITPWCPAVRFLLRLGKRDKTQPNNDHNDKYKRHTCLVSPNNRNIRAKDIGVQAFLYKELRIGFGSKSFLKYSNSRFKSFLRVSCLHTGKFDPKERKLPSLDWPQTALCPRIYDWVFSLPKYEKMNTRFFYMKHNYEKYWSISPKTMRNI